MIIVKLDYAILKSLWTSIRFFHWSMGICGDVVTGLSSSTCD
jgi:hypothetical protein